MNKNLYKFLKKPVVLYVLVVLTIISIIRYVLENDYNSLLTMTIIALITSYFSKLKSVILLSSLLFTFILYKCKCNLVEKFEGDEIDDGEEEELGDDEDEDDEDDDEGLEGLEGFSKGAHKLPPKKKNKKKKNGFKNMNGGLQTANVLLDRVEGLMSKLSTL